MPTNTEFIEIEASTTPTALTVTPRSCVEVILRADPANTNDVLVGDVSGQAFPLGPDDPPVHIRTKRPDKIFVSVVADTEDLHVILVR